MIEDKNTIERWKLPQSLAAKLSQTRYDVKLPRISAKIGNYLEDVCETNNNKERHCNSDLVLPAEKEMELHSIFFEPKLDIASSSHEFKESDRASSQQ